MQKRKIKAAHKLNKEVSFEAMSELKKNVDKLYTPYQEIRNVLSEPSQCLMCL